ERDTLGDRLDGEIIVSLSLLMAERPELSRAAGNDETVGAGGDEAIDICRESLLVDSVVLGERRRQRRKGAGPIDVISIHARSPAWVLRYAKSSGAVEDMKLRGAKADFRALTHVETYMSRDASLDGRAVQREQNDALMAGGLHDLHFGGKPYIVDHDILRTNAELDRRDIGPGGRDMSVGKRDRRRAGPDLGATIATAPVGTRKSHGPSTGKIG